MRPGRTSAWSVRWFSATVGVGFVSTLIGLYLVVRFAGAGMWSGLAVGQTVGTLAAVPVTLGWTLRGPADVATMSAERATRYVAVSIRARLLACGTLLVPTVVITAVVLPGAAHSTVPGLVVAVGRLASGLGAEWYFIGIRRPDSLFLWTTVPRACGVLVGSAAVVMTQDAVGFAIGVFLGEVAAVTLPYAKIIGLRGLCGRLGRGELVAELRRHVDGVVSVVAATSYSQAPLVMASALTNTGIVPFALADRMQKFASWACQPMIQVVQGRVPSASPDVAASRARRAASLGALANLALAAGFAVALVPASRILSSDEIHVSPGLAIAVGLTLGTSNMAALLSYGCLASIGAADVVRRGSLFGLLGGVPVLVALTLRFGVGGAAWSMAVTEGVVAGWFWMALVRRTATG